MEARDEVIECPCYRVCSEVGLPLKRWCRYHRSEEPSPGVLRVDPQSEWCPPGVQANTLLLAYMLVQGGDAALLKHALRRVREWATEVRGGPANPRVAG